MTDLPDCRYAQQHLWQDSAGDWWETFEIPDRVAGTGKGVRIDNEIIRPSAATQTPPSEVLSSRNLCAVTPTPVTAVLPTTAPPSTGEGGIGLLLVLGLAGSAIWAWFNKGKDNYADDYHPMADAPHLPPVYMEAHSDPQGNQILGTPTVQPSEFDQNSSDFAGNSQFNEGELPTQPLPQKWPPKSMGAPYDPLMPEQAGEFAAYCRALQSNGLTPRGNEVLKAMWGVTPGRSKAYQAARQRRDTFAKRLDYYRYEEM